MKNIRKLMTICVGLSAASVPAYGGEVAMVPVSEPDLLVPLCDGRILGDLGGIRRPDDNGIDFYLEANNFYHGVLDGDDGPRGRSDMEFSGKLDLFLNVDGQKAGLWPGFFVNIHGEYRYGDVANQGGVLSPTNSALLLPRTGEGDVFALTNVTVTQALSESFLITLGKFNTIDLVKKNFYGGRGVEGFMNTSLTAMPIAGRTVPTSTLGAVATILKDGKPYINFGVLDSVSTALKPGWDGLSSDEMTFLADITFNSNFWGLPGTHTVQGTYSTLNATSLDQNGLLNDIIGGGGLNPRTESDSWHVNYIWEQFLSQHSSDPTKGWGFFLFLGVSDGNPNAIEYSAAAGLVANGTCAARPCDRFGVGLFYNGVSDDLQDTVGDNPAPLPSVSLDDELGGEIFYDFAVTDWFRITADLQVIQPVLDDNDTAIIGGFRSRLIF